jgi:hypothetical protein
MAENDTAPNAALAPQDAQAPAEQASTAPGAYLPAPVSPRTGKGLVELRSLPLGTGTCVAAASSQPADSGTGFVAELYSDKGYAVTRLTTLAPPGDPCERRWSATAARAEVQPGVYEVRLLSYPWSALGQGEMTVRASQWVRVMPNRVTALRFVDGAPLAVPSRLDVVEGERATAPGSVLTTKLTILHRDVPVWAVLAGTAGVGIGIGVAVTLLAKRGGKGKPEGA